MYLKIYLYNKLREERVRETNSLISITLSLSSAIDISNIDHISNINAKIICSISYRVPQNPIRYYQYTLESADI